MTPAALNQKRWSVNQRRLAGARFAAGLPSLDDQRKERLAGLLALAATLNGVPNMASTLESVSREISKLESQKRDSPK